MFNSAPSFASDFVNSSPSPVPTPQLPSDKLDPAAILRVLDEIDYGLMLVTPDGRLSSHILCQR